MGFVAFVLLAILIWISLKLKKANKDLEESETSLKNSQHELDIKTQEFTAYKEKTVHLKQYEIIDDAKKESEDIIERAENRLRESEIEYHKKISEAQILAAEEVAQARIQASLTKEKSELKLAKAHEIATKIEYEANKNAESIAGEAW